MRLGRIAAEDGAQFVVSDQGDDWFSLRNSGPDVTDTESAIENWADIRRMVGDQKLPKIDTPERFLAPVVKPGKILVIGLNYLDHIREQDATAPDRPVVFAKYSNAINGPEDPIVMDERLTSQGDYEVELAVVIGERARWVDRGEALETVFGYAVANDVSARDLQRSDAQFSRSKSMDTFCPIGPWITTADEVRDPQDLRLWSKVNGELRQDSSTREMVYSVADLIEFLSQTMTLEPGDVILTGTPHGVGFVMDPPQFLQPGDVVECEVEGLGALRNPVVGPDDA